MTSTEVALVAALGASALTGLASLGVVWMQEWRRQKASDEDALRGAAGELLSRSMAISARAQTLGNTMRLRSGLKEGFDVAMRHRKLMDPLELHDWMAQDIIPLNAALDEIWTRDNQEGIRLANAVVSECTNLLGVNTARQPTSNGWDAVRRWAAGDQWTPETTEELNRALRSLAQARKVYAEHVRQRFGLQAVELFTLAEKESDKAAMDATESSKTSEAASLVAALPAASEAATPVKRRRFWERGQ
jgi:hypothetical protein